MRGTNHEAWREDQTESRPIDQARREESTGVLRWVEMKGEGGER